MPIALEGEPGRQRCVLRWAVVVFALLQLLPHDQPYQDAHVSLRNGVREELDTKRVLENRVGAVPGGSKKSAPE